MRLQNCVIINMLRCYTTTMKNIRSCSGTVDHGPPYTQPVEAAEPLPAGSLGKGWRQVPSQSYSKESVAECVSHGIKSPDRAYTIM